jgi:hypothetical protein
LITWHNYNTTMDKTRKLIHLQHFKEICGFFPDGEIEKNREKPDFIVHAEDNLLGIEHTEIFQSGISGGESLQAQDALALRVVSQASALYSRDNNKPLYVQIMFRPKVNIRKQDVTRLADIVARLIEKTPLTPGIPISLKRTRENSNYFPIEIAMIHLYSHPNGNESLWRCSSAGFIPEITANYLQEKIDQKEEKYDVYRSQCSELWLLIVADDLRIPSFLDMSGSASLHHYRTRFDRIFFFWNASRHYFELQLTRSAKS